jgi:hypothetical protein
MASVILFCACGGGASTPSDAGPPAFTAPPFESATSVSGALTVAVQSDPSPPARGQNALRFTITGTDGGAMNGLSLSVQPWMPEMGHGSSVAPVVTPEDGGIYDITNVYLAMPGTWEMRTTVDGPQSDHVTPSFQVP